jgi:hypothetical protein
MRAVVGLWLLAMTLLLASIDAAAENSQQPSIFHKAIFGLALHDRGFASDRHENGVDPNLELQFNPPDWRVWHWIGSPLLKVGATPNFNGDTSVLYAGITYEFSLANKYTDALTRDFTKTLFIAGGLSAALHNGPLHKNKIGCEEHSDCGFGYRVLPRLDIELGKYFGKNQGLSLFYDHMSHKGILPGENEGIDHIGIRYHYTFSKPTS